ncbi:lisH domain-containing protein ARMC9-like isoform X2 [Glandiceps talaboti]
MGSKKTPVADTVVAFESELNSIVKEYLDFCNYDKTVGAFDNESKSRGKAIKSRPKPQWNKQKLDIQSDVLSMFQLGARREFFQLWDDNIPDKIRKSDPVCKKLEFYVSIYFAIYPIRHGLVTGRENKSKTEESMQEFKTFLEDRGAPLSQTTEFLPFYALPFVPNPTQHPSFKELFQDMWVPDLQIRLEKFLTLALKSQPQPKLLEIYQDMNSESAQQIQALQQSLVDTERRTMTYMKRYNKVQADYHNLIGITAELVDSLESCINGNTVTPEYLQTVCEKLFANTIRESVDISRPGTAGTLLRASAMPHSSGSEDNAFPHLDYPKVKGDLVNGDDRRKILLLQALRWRLTRSQSGDQRDSIISAYCSNDLLGCAQRGDYQEQILDLLSSPQEGVRQYIARLFNAFASLAEGRTYIAKNVNVLPVLQETLQSEDKDSITRENILGALQKLSLKRALQTQMIEGGMIVWLVSVLEDSDALSDYTLEYSVALLMNLCLRTAGKLKCTEDAAHILKVLSDLLGHENQEIRPYVNGALYSILSIPTIRDEARAMGLEEILRCFLKGDNPDMNRQIQFIIKQLNSNDAPDDGNDSDDEEEDDDEEEQDAMESDLDKAEVIKANHGELAGEQLLQSEYQGTSANTWKPRKNKLLDGLLDEPLKRPVTPSARRMAADIPPSPVPSTAPSRSLSHLNGQISRPVTRSGSRPGTQNSRPGSSGSRPGSQQSLPPINSDPEAQRMLENATGQARSVAAAHGNSYVKPSDKALQNLNGTQANPKEYTVAFSSRPKIPRTPDVNSSRPDTRGGLKTPPPQPQASSSPPLSRPSSSGRQSNASKLKDDSRPASQGSQRPSSRGQSGSRPSSQPSLKPPSASSRKSAASQHSRRGSSKVATAK